MAEKPLLRHEPHRFDSDPYLGRILDDIYWDLSKMATRLGIASAYDPDAEAEHSILDDGTVPMAANWEMGNYTLTANGLTIDGTFTDGTLSIVGGNLTEVVGVEADANLAFKIAGNAILNLAATSLLPEANNVVDFGSGAKSFKDIYLDGILYFDSDVELYRNAEDVLYTPDNLQGTFFWFDVANKKFHLSNSTTFGGNWSGSITYDADYFGDPYNGCFLFDAGIDVRDQYLISAAGVDIGSRSATQSIYLVCPDSTTASPYLQIWHDNSGSDYVGKLKLDTSGLFTFLDGSNDSIGVVALSFNPSGGTASFVGTTLTNMSQIGTLDDADLLEFSSGFLTVNGEINATTSCTTPIVNSNTIVGDNGTELRIGAYNGQLQVYNGTTRVSFGLRLGADELSFCSWNGAGTQLELIRGAKEGIGCFSASTTGETESFRIYGFATGDELRYLDTAFDSGGDIDLGVYKIHVDGDILEGDINFFGRINVGDAVDGNAVFIHRKAEEYNAYYKFYIDQYAVGQLEFSSYTGKNFRISSTASVEFYPGYGYKCIFAPTGRDIDFGGSSMGEGKNPVIKHYGYITNGTDEQYVQWKVDDASDDWFTLTKEANIAGFDVQMQLRCDTFRLDTPALGGTTCIPDDYFIISLNGSNYKVPCLAV